MTNETDGPRDVAVDRLEALGLSEYAARTYVALVTLGQGTAKDVAEASTVPRTRVYDAAEELRRMSLVDVNQSSPKEFAPVSVETTARRFERRYARHVEDLTTALQDVETAPRTAEQRGVWTVTGRTAVTDRVIEFVDGATDEVVYMTVADLLTDDVTRALRAAADRGVDVSLAGVSDGVEATVREAVPDAETFASLWTFADTPAGRVVMIDGRKTLVSVLADDGDVATTEREETAIWGTGEANSLVVVLRALFTWQLADNTGRDGRAP